MKLKMMFLLAIALTSFPFSRAFADKITLAADSWMPYNGDGMSETGYMLDIAKAVFEAKGHTVEFAATTWSRSINQCRTGSFTGIVGAALGDAPDFIFPSEELGLSSMAFYVSVDSKWKYNGIGSLKGLRLAIIKDYSYFDALDEYIASNSPPAYFEGFGEDALEKNINLMLIGNADVVIDDIAVMKYTIEKMKLGSKVTFAGTGDETTGLYIAFSPKNPKSAEYAKILSEGIIALRKSGQLKKILAKYGLTDWK